MAKVEVIHYNPDAEKLVALSAKRSISRKPVTEIEMKEKDIERWILETFKRQHWSPWEYAWYVFEVVDCSRVCTHQLVRHRIASYIQLSQRHSLHLVKTLVEKLSKYAGHSCVDNDYMCYAMVIERFVDDLRVAYQMGKHRDLLEVLEVLYEVPDAIKKNDELYMEYATFLLRITQFYLAMVSRGVTYEDARYILPQAIKTRILVGMNARELVTSFLPLRMCSRAQREIREVAWRLWHKLVRIHPRLFRYVGPRCVISENTLRETPVDLREFLEGKEDFKVIPRCPELVPRREIRKCLVAGYKDALRIE